MQDRLRRLDALFAEKVLGCKVHYGPDPCPNCHGAKIELTDQVYFTTGPSAVKRRKAGEACGQCDGAGEVNWHGDGPVCRCADRDHNDDRGDLNDYTRSLDAAWKGVASLVGTGLWEVEFAREERRTDTWKCYLRGMDKEKYPPRGEFVHPAEALVLACLRAVGVSEEDLK